MNSSPESFPELYAQFKSLVYNVALSYFQNKEDAEEITQDVFINYFSPLPISNKNQP